MKSKDLALLIARIAALAVVLMLINGLALRFLPAAQETSSPGEAATAASPPGASFLALAVTLMLMQTIALAYPIVRSRWYGWKLALGLSLLYFGTVTFMSQIESLVYLEGKMPEGMLGGLFAMGAVVAIVFAPIAVLVLGKWKPPQSEAETERRYEPTSAVEWAWKIAVCAFVFLALYYLFGYFIAWQIPELREYYGGTDPGSFLAQMKGIAQGTPWMIPFQYLRGLMWVGLAILVIRIMKGAWWEAGLATALLFAVPSLYLLLPNELMPEPIRMGHLIETLPYQFMFGWFAAWLFCRLGESRLEETASGA